MSNSQRTYQPPNYVTTPNNLHQIYPSSYWLNEPIDNFYNMQRFYGMHPSYYRFDSSMYNLDLKDYGSEPFAINIDMATIQNNTYRTALWTGQNLQVTLMNIDVGDDIGLEVHLKGDQFIRIEEGQGVVVMGDSKNNLDFKEKVYDDFAIMIPAGKWHNVINTGNTPLKLYAIYAPPEHPRNTVHVTKADSEAT